MEQLDLEALANLGEFVSALAVVVSLIYLAFQVRQNTVSQRTENYARALERIALMQSQLSSDGAFASIIMRGSQDHTRLTTEERAQFSWTFYEMFGAFEFMFLQAEAGALHEDVWNRWSATLAWWISFPGVRAWWAARPTPFSPSFTRHIDEHASRHRPDPDAAKRWREFLLGPDPG